MWDKAIKIYVPFYLLVFSMGVLERPTFGTQTDERLFNSITQISVTGDREPSSGGVRTLKSETDIRHLFISNDQREMIVSVWSPRLHPFKEPPDYKVSRTCRFGEILESTIGVTDISKSHILRKTGRGQKVPDAFEWNDKTLLLTQIQAPSAIPFKYESMGKVFEYIKIGSCQYLPTALRKDENPRTYFFKHLQIAKAMNATDIAFPKATLDFITPLNSSIGSEYAIALRDYRDLVLDFGGGTLLLPPNFGGFSFQNCQRIVIKNLSVEWAHPPQTSPPAYSGPQMNGFFSPKENNHDLWFTNISLKRVPGWGFYFDSTPGIYVGNNTISSFPGETLPSARQGAVRVINSQDTVITGNQFENLGSDGISVHGQFAVVLSPPYKPQRDNSSFPLSCVGVGASWGAFAQEESLGFFSDSLAFQGETKLRRANFHSLGDSGAPSYCKGFSHCGEICYVPNSAIQPSVGGYVTSTSKTTSLFIISNNHLSDISGRGIAVQGVNGRITENTIDRSGGPGIELSADLANQLQGPGTYNLLLKNNIIKNAVQNHRYLADDVALFGGISIGATSKERDGRTVLVKAPLNQHIRIEGSKSSIDQSGSVSLMISSAKHIDVSHLKIGSAGLFRNLSSGSMSGSMAEGSVLVTRSQQIDLGGLTTPASVDRQVARTRTIVIDSQNVTQFRIPLSTHGQHQRSANTLWHTTFRNWFKEEIETSPKEMTLVIDSPGLSIFHKKPPVIVLPVTNPQVGDKERTSTGLTLTLASAQNRWTTSLVPDWQSPHRLQIRPNFRGVYPNLFLTIDNVSLRPKKQSTSPLES